MKASLTKRNFNKILEEEDIDTLMHGDMVVKRELGELSIRKVGYMAEQSSYTTSSA